jgi:hypothetical protein
MMVTFIAQRIEEARDISLEKGRDKYRAYFIKTKLYKKYKADVDAILEQDGYEDCIVEA